MALLNLLIEDPRAEDLRKLEIQATAFNKVLVDIQVGFGRLEERINARTNTLEQTVTAFQGQITTLRDSTNHLPSRTVLYSVAISLAGLVVAISVGLGVAYWNGFSGRFEAISAHFDSITSEMDSLSNRMDGLTKTVDGLSRPRNNRLPDHR